MATFLQMTSQHLITFSSFLKLILHYITACVSGYCKNMVVLKSLQVHFQMKLTDTNWCLFKRSKPIKKLMDDLENAQQDWKVLSLPFAVTLPMQNFQHGS